MSNQLAAAVRFLLAASDPKTEQQYECWKSLKEAIAAHEAAKERTGWPADGRMAQDDSRELSKWLSNTPGARRLVDEATKPAASAVPPSRCQCGYPMPCSKTVPVGFCRSTHTGANHE